MTSVVRFNHVTFKARLGVSHIPAVWSLVQSVKSVNKAMGLSEHHNVLIFIFCTAAR